MEYPNKQNKQGLAQGEPRLHGLFLAIDKFDWEWDCSNQISVRLQPQLPNQIKPNQTSSWGYQSSTGKLIVVVVVVHVVPHTINYLLCGVPTPSVPSSTKYVRCPPHRPPSRKYVRCPPHSNIEPNIEPNIETQYWNPILNPKLNSKLNLILNPIWK